MNQILALALYRTRGAFVEYSYKENQSCLHQVDINLVLSITDVDPSYSLVVTHIGPIVSLRREILETLQHGKLPPLTQTHQPRYSTLWPSIVVSSILSVSTARQSPDRHRGPLPLSPLLPLSPNYHWVVGCIWERRILAVVEEAVAPATIAD